MIISSSQELVCYKRMTWVFGNFIDYTSSGVDLKSSSTHNAIRPDGIPIYLSLGYNMLCTTIDYSAIDGNTTIWSHRRMEVYRIVGTERFMLAGAQGAQHPKFDGARPPLLPQEILLVGFS